MRPLRLQTILVATDLSTDDLPALRTAYELAQLADARLHVVHAAPVADGEVVARLEQYVRLEPISSFARPATHVHAGNATDVIVEVSNEVDADVIVLGPHRLHGPAPMEKTAYRVAATSERSCLVLPGSMNLPLSRILVPVDSSAAARGALAVGLTWASALRHRPTQPPSDSTELFVLHVETGVGEGASADDAMRVLMADVNERIMSATGIGVRCVEVAGADPASVIGEHSATHGIDLIVLGTRAESAPEPRLGSVSSAVVTRATGPVLLVPPRVWQAEDRELLS
jgi:nucleotide-binding universal stress UspA family protein